MGNLIYSYGLVTDVTKTDKGYIYAEITHAAQPWWRRLLPNVRNYWIEVNEVEGDVCTHHYLEDTGAYTFSGALLKASVAVQNVEEINYDQPK